MKKMLKSFSNKKIFDLIYKNRFFTIIKIGFLVLLLIVVIFLTPTTFSRYESSGISDTGMDVAFYLLKTDYHTENILISEIVPRDEPYTYTFDVSNFKGNKRSETNMQYDLSIKTTTNLPLEYELYLDEEYTSNSATNILSSSSPIQDDDGTYFINFTTPTRYFYHTANETHTYQLVVYFPEDYIGHEYQDIYESVQIIVDSKQVINNS